MLASVMLFAGGMSTGILLCLTVETLLHALHTHTISCAQGSESAVSSEADSPYQSKRFPTQWIHHLLYRSALVLVLILAYGLYASFASAQATLRRIDPLVFSAFQLGLFFPIAVAILGWTFRPATSRSVRLGLVGGGPTRPGLCVYRTLVTYSWDSSYGYAHSP